jgi:hypothetical protein
MRIRAKLDPQDGDAQFNGSGEETELRQQQEQQKQQDRRNRRKTRTTKAGQESESGTTKDSSRPAKGRIWINSNKTKTNSRRPKQDKPEDQSQSSQNKQQSDDKNAQDKNFSRVDSSDKDRMNQPGSGYAGQMTRNKCRSFSTRQKARRRP